MNENLNKNQTCLLNILYFIFVFSFLYVIGNVIKLEMNIFYQFILVVLLCYLVRFLISKPIVLPTILLFGLITAILINIYIFEFFPMIIERSIYFFANIIENLKGQENILEENILLLFIIVTLLISSFTFFFMFKKKNPWMILVFYIPIYIYYWYKFFDESLILMAIFLIAFFIFIGLHSYEKEKIRTKNSLNYDFKEVYPIWKRTIIRYAVTIIIISLLLPKLNSYIPWPWLNRQITSIFPVIEDLRASEKYSRRRGEASLFNFSSTGFLGKDDKLGGPVVLSDKIVMTVSSPKSVYLRGNAKEKYTGFSWVSLDKSSKNYRLGKDFSGINDEEKTSHYEEIDITIKNHLFSSTSIFSPYKPSKVFSNDKYNIIVDSDDTIKTLNGIYKDESYLVRVLLPQPYGILKSTGINKTKDQLENLDIYLDVPDIISDRTIELTQNITSGKNTDFEKAVAIESFLRNNYEYNIDVKEIPFNAEFLDYFLFEEKTGYCTYYATSMAIMLRIEGIPSRYIEGYLAKDKIEDEKYEVRQKNAHAWIEAFIEPVGWMSFEPTPAFSISPRYEDYGSENESIVPLEINNENLNIEDFKNLGGSAYETDENLHILDNSDDYLKRSNNGEVDYKFTLLTILGVILAFILFNIIKTTLNYRKRKLQFKSLSNNEKIIFLYEDITHLIGLLGYPQKYGETHFEYAVRINYKFHDLDNIGIKEITDIFVKSKYSEQITSNENIDMLIKYKKTLENRLKNHLGKLKYYYKKSFYQNIKM